MTDFITWADREGGDPNVVEGLSFSTTRVADPLRAGDYVIIADGRGYTPARQWLAQSMQPAMNVTLTGLARDNPSTVAAIHRVLKQEIDASIFLVQQFYYRFSLLGEIMGNTLQGVDVRPTMASIGMRAPSERVIELIGLPEVHGAMTANNVIGLVNRDVPITLDVPTLSQHLLIAGATGSGKSNTVANVIKAAVLVGMAVVVLDHKPDYQEADQPNDEASLFNGLPYEPHPLSQVLYSVLYSPSLRTEPARHQAELWLGVMASDLPFGMLSHAIFHRREEENMRMQFFDFLDWFSEQRRDDWTLRDLFSELERQAPEDEREGPLRSQIHVWRGIRRRLRSAARKPHWIDDWVGVAQSNGVGALLGNGGHPTTVRRVSDYIRPGRVLIVRLPPEIRDREYSLYLSYVLDDLYRQQVRPLLVVVDEAQNIFNGEPALKHMAEDDLYEKLRQGRSTRMGFVFSVQSASQVPSTIIQNLNTKIIHRQNTNEEFKDLTDIPRETLNTVLSFGPGQALVKMFGVTGVLRARMLPSPFRLTRWRPS